MKPRGADLPDYRHILRLELEMRAARHPGFSQRAFARRLAMSPGHLSEVLNRRKALSEASAVRIGDALGWDRDRTRHFAALVRLEAAETEPLKEAIAAELRAQPASPFQPISGERLDSGFNWYYLAISDLFGVRSFKPDLRWIAGKLRLTLIEVEAAIQWLRENGVVEGKGATLRRQMTSFVLRRPTPEVVRRLYRTSLDLAKAALATQKEGTAEFGVVTLSFDPTRWAEAIAIIRRCQAEIASLARPGEDPAVYQLGIQFFRLDVPEQETP